MEFCKPFEVSSSNDLICKLHSYDTSVPQRGQGRKTEHTERWVTCRFLRAIADTPLLSYPLRVESRDKPDLVLEIKTREPKQIGIEITEAVPQVYGKPRSQFCSVRRFNWYFIMFQKISLAFSDYPIKNSKS